MLPKDIKLHRKSGLLELQYQDGSHELEAEFLRVHSPSAEVKGHGPGQEVLQFGKREVLISGIEAVGNYALRLHFDDGHNTGLYTWEYLRYLCLNKDELWQQYLQRLKDAGKSRDANTQVVTLTPLKPE